MSREQDSNAFERDYDTVSLVYTFTQEADQIEFLNLEDVEGIEDDLGGTGQLIQGLGERGPTTQLVIPTMQVDVNVSSGRFEVRSRGSKFTEETSTRMGRLLDRTITKLVDVRWESLGYNFILSGQSEEVAIKHLETNIFKEKLRETLGHNLLGGSGSLWIDVGDSRLLLRVDPVRRSPTSHRYTVNANFSVTLPDNNLPSSEQSIDQLQKYCVELDKILQALHL